MNNILGLDLGTNSIGWAIRNVDLQDNQIEKFGVITFKKGIGKEQTGEYSYAAQRTKKRATRRLYQARKYRLWKTLEHLITEGYCPLSIEDLNRWRYYNKVEAKMNNNAGRIYPSENNAFDSWIKLDFNNDGIPDYSSPYQLRKELAIFELDMNDITNRYKLGRALYHIAQRRGFKSSRKSSDDNKENEINEVMDLQYSEMKKNKLIAELHEKYSAAKTIGWLYALLENDCIRIRKSIAQYAIRENYKDEIKYIFNETQKLGLKHPLYSKLVETSKNKNDGSIFYKRPLRSQKGLIGKCTLETNKYRVSISHPAFETFRAWSFLNNIKFKEEKEWRELPLELKQNIYDELFFRKSKAYFPFAEIVTLLNKKGYKWELNYKPYTTVTACPVSAKIKDIFGKDYLKIRIKKDQKSKTGKDYYDIEDIWHVLFNYEDQEYILEFAKNKLKLEVDKIKQFVGAWNTLPIGYSMLSLNAINKINVFLQKGLIYTEAVLLANIPEIIGADLWKENEQLLLDSIGQVVAENRQQKTILGIVNSLVAKHKNLEVYERFTRNDYILDNSDLKAIEIAIEEHFGKSRWNNLPTEERKIIFDTVKDCYQAYFAKKGIIRDNGREERIVTVHSSNKKYYKTETGFYRLPKLMDTLKEFLQNNFEHLDSTKLSKIYHPSEINIYPPAKEIDGILKLGSPKTGSFKNPMAMRTLHELRKLVNYMIETKQVDNETRVVVEVARDLNDANRRWAIEAWQRQRELENQQFAEAIKKLLGEDSNIKANDKSNDDINKVRLFYEQNTELTLPKVVEMEEEGAGEKKKKKTTKKDEAIRWNGYGKKLIDKYRLWKEQGYQCFYTGKFIKLTDLFNENVIDFEHTVPRSKSFDNSLANLTVCYHDYNTTIKKNQIPTQMPNYDQEYDFGGNIGKCTAILPRLEHWVEKVKRIKQQIDFWKSKSKKESDKKWKDDAIQQRHLWQMELDYWENKLDRFKLTDITSGFKNSQKVDTQLISKYAFHYLKTYFDKVDVQKGSITAEFRKIYELQGSDEKKDRSKHSHHAKDAAVLTLIPTGTKRDEVLEKYYEAKEKNPKTKFTSEPYKYFKREYVWNIDDSVLINNITNNQQLTPAKRKVRKRGKEVFIEKPNGTKVNKWATGDSIRGQLHQETFYGAIKPAQKGENGNLLKDEQGRFIQVEDPLYVIRIPFEYKKDPKTPGFETLDEIKKKIVDEGLKDHIEKQVNEAGGLKEAFEKGMFLLDKNGKPHGNKIRHIRVWARVNEPLAIKKQTNLSDKEYKQHYWAANGENFICAYYKNDFIDMNGNLIKDRKLEIINLFDVSNLKKFQQLKSNGELLLYRKDNNNQVIIDGNGNKQTPYVLLKAGMKVIFYNENIDELKKMQNETERDYNKRISYRTYKVVKYAGSQITFSHHLDARNDQELKKAYPDYKQNENGEYINENGDIIKRSNKQERISIYGVAGTSGFTRKVSDALTLNTYNNYEPFPRLLYTADWLDFAVEGHDFEIKMDGSIVWINK